MTEDPKSIWPVAKNEWEWWARPAFKAFAFALNLTRPILTERLYQKAFWAFADFVGKHGVHVRVDWIEWEDLSSDEREYQRELHGHERSER